MVQFTTVLAKKSTRLTRNYLRSGFKDSLRIFVQGGSGGNGLPKFGGIGGKGGDVIAVGKDNVTLENVIKKNPNKRFIAKPGRHSSHNFILGVPGEDLKIDVPVGVTLITDLGKKIGELNVEGEELVVAKGGPGGNHRNGFLGVKGQAYPIKLDLKLIADIGIVGFPNAGKSTFLSAISHAKPKIAAYPFTTVKPHIGIINYKDLRQISMADLPGLIEGAYRNKGMGHQFLKHIERTKLLLMIVDINGFQLSPQYPHRNCLENIILLIKELEMYNKDLLQKPSMLLINKMDSEGALKKFEEVREQLKNITEVIQNYPEELRPNQVLKFCDTIPISAKEHPDDVELVKRRLRNLLDVLSEIEEKEAAKQNELYEDIRSTMKEKGPTLI